MAENQDTQALKDDMAKLKEQMDEMMTMKEQMNEIMVMKDQMAELMKLIERRNAGNAENIATSLPPPHNSGINGQNYQWPPYGLPIGYTPPTGEAIFESGTSGAAIQDQPGAVEGNGAVGPQLVQNTNSGITQGLLANYTSPPVTIPPVLESNFRNRPRPVTVSLTHPCYDGNQFPRSYPAEHPQPGDKLQMLEERLRAVEGSNVGAKDAYDLCLVPNIIIPPKFKVPDFDKYKGITCPASHLTMYCRRMAAFAHHDQLLIHYFQDSLAGAASSWYMQLERTHIRCWKDLADAFLKQYKYNIDMAPDRVQLQNMIKKNNESFKEYAQRWRGLAAQVVPPLSEREMVSLFMDTLQAPFYDKLIGSVSSNFSDMVMIGERVEVGMRKGKITNNYTGASSTSKFPTVPTKKIGETNAITDQRKPHYSYQQPFQSSQHQGSPQYDPIPMSYTDLCSNLIGHNLISPRSMKPVQPPFPRGYNPNARCEFHAGAVGHSAENCYPLKHLVQGLIDAKKISFKEDDGGSTVSQNPQNTEVSDQNISC